MHPDEVMALATVMQVDGSSYRRPGARMLIRPGGQTVGTISGGCLEQDVLCHAVEIIQGGEPKLLTYDTASEEDILFGVGLGCNGVVRILLERLEPLHSSGVLPLSVIEFIAQLFHRKQTGVVATVFRLQGDAGIPVGSRLMLHRENQVVSGSFTPALQEQALAQARKCLSEQKSCVERYPTEDGAATILFEVLRAPPRLFIFGAGYDARPLVRLAKELGLRVSVVDARPAYATADRFPEADDVILAAPESDGIWRTLDERSAAVIMSHNYAADCAWLNRLLPLPLAYLGLMGPRKRAERMLRQLCAEGFRPSNLQLAKLHNPVGLDLGAENPEQIALSILAELQAKLAGHSGGSLRDKRASIHSACGWPAAFSPAKEPNVCLEPLS